MLEIKNVKVHKMHRVHRRGVLNMEVQEDRHNFYFSS